MKTKYDTDKTKLENKIVTHFVKKAKLTELENKILDISNLATKSALNTLENKILDVNKLAKKQIIILKLLILKISLIIMINILILRSLIN